MIMTIFKTSKAFIVLSALAAYVLLGGTVHASEVTGTISSAGGGSGATVVEAPSASPIAGSYTGTQSVALTATNSDSIHYSVDGTTPTCSTGTTYSGAVSVSSDKTIKAISCYPNSVASDVVDYAYTITAASSGGGGGGGGGGGSSFNSDTVKPIVTIVGETPMSVPLNGTYVELGATATDDVTPSSSLVIIVNGDTVDTAVEGTYHVAYRTTDAAGNVSETVIRDVNVGVASVPTVVAGLDSQGTGSGGVASTGQVLGVSTFKFLINLHLGMRHNDVTELQNRLVVEGLYSGPVTGYFGQLTLAAAKRYQERENIVPVSGYVGPLTRAALNDASSPAVGQSEGVVNGLTQAQHDAIQAQITSMMALLQTLMEQLAAL